MRHCTWAFLVILFAAAGGASAQTPAAAPSAVAYQLFVRGIPVGREEVTIRSDAQGTTIHSEGRLAAPVNVTLRRGEVSYQPDWTTRSLSLDADVNGVAVSMDGRFAGGSANLQVSQGGASTNATQPVSARTVVVPNLMLGAYAALARRLSTDLPGTELRAYVPGQMEVPVEVVSVSPEQVQVATTIIPVRRYELALKQPGGDLPMTVVATAQGDLMRLLVPSQTIEFIRADLASSNARTQVFSNPGDEAVVIPTEFGFNIAATLTRPRQAAARMPAVVLLAGSGVTDRDGFVAGIPVMAQLAGAMADAGFLAVRYDKRGFGQTGGRDESATITDYADDARAVVKWLANRKDIDPKRIAVVGHDEGAMVALIAASKDRRIAAIVSLAGPSGTASELLFEKQQAAFAVANTPQPQREQQVALQRQIEQAVLTGKGWEGVPPEMRQQADTPWFQSVLQYNPAKVLDDVRQPILVVHGALDRELAPGHADKLAALARAESKSKAVEVVIVRGVNHLLVPAVTGEVGEYATLPDRAISADVTTAVTGWLTKSFQAIK